MGAQIAMPRANKTAIEKISRRNGASIAIAVQWNSRDAGSTGSPSGV